MQTKKLLFLFSILLSMIGTKASAYDIAVENSDGVTIYYNYINDGKELKVTYKNIDDRYGGSVVIPEEVTYMDRTRKVTSIGDKAFFMSFLTSVTIPNSVVNIGESAFGSCFLTSITIPTSVTTIGDGAFAGCLSLTSMVIPNSVTSIKSYTFAYCDKLTSITIGNGVKVIGYKAFYKCKSLTSVIFPNGMTRIVDDAFRECSGLTSVTIPNSVTDIGRGAFAYCSSLTSITIPNNVTSIGDQAFDGCDMQEVISKIENPFYIYSEIFSVNTFYNATLYVPAGTIDQYKATEGWKKFLFIKEGNGNGSTTDSPKCEKPMISYQNGKLIFSCNTEGATCQSTITDTDIASYSSNEVQLGVTYNISVFASKAGYENSETVYATLCWIDVEPKTEGIVNSIAQVRANAVIIKTEGGRLTIEGVNDDTNISVYTIDGVQVGSAISKNGVALVNTNITSNSFAIVRIGNKSVKVLMK